MKLYLAGVLYNTKPQGVFVKNIKHNRFFLESFYYRNVWEKHLAHVENISSDAFMLDSGAFTLFTTKNDKVIKSLDQYVEEYCDFIVKNNIHFFFELDIDALIGYDKVLGIRKKIEKKTVRQCIPVWHKSRGKNEFLKMCDEYKYVSIGGIASREIKRRHYDIVFPWAINEAHKRGCKIHGLGFTDLKGMRTHKFDSVDSSTWNVNAVHGHTYTFYNGSLLRRERPTQMRIKDRGGIVRYNLMQWTMLQDSLLNK